MKKDRDLEKDEKHTCMDDSIYQGLKKPKVYPYVARWFDECGSKDSWWNWIYKWGRSEYSNSLEEKVYKWFIDYNEDNFIDMFRYGYKVVQEQRYYVINNHDIFILKNKNGIATPTSISKKYISENVLKTYQLTEEQIVSYDKSYMEFAKKEDKLKLGE